MEDLFRERHDVQQFQTRFAIPMAETPSLLHPDLFAFRAAFLHEELTEFCEAHRAQNLPEAADGLVDLAYVLHGTALMMGLPWSTLWQTVHQKNMQKVRVRRPDESARQSMYDVVKPQGWTPPNHRLILGEGPWPMFTPVIGTP